VNRITPAPALAGLLCLVALAAPAASATRPARTPFVSVSATPAQVTMPGRSSRTIVLSNRGSARVAVDVAAANFAFDSVGRARIGLRTAPPRSARAWLSVKPRLRVLAPGASASVTVTARAPRGAEPGDHHALVLLTTRPVRRGPVAIRTRVGVLVLVRVRGRISRRLELRSLAVRRLAHGRVVQILVANSGNVTERLLGRSVTVSLVRNGRRLTTVAALPRDLLPRTSGQLLVPYRGRLRGDLRAVVHIRPLRAALDGPGAPELRPLTRSFRIRL
jgi:hypothetical protein